MATGTNAIETLAPPALGGDADLAEIKKRVGDKVCLIGGVDQANALERGCADSVEKEVKRCIEETGEGGGYIMMTADHFFGDACCDVVKVERALFLGHLGVKHHLEQ